jgi:hypothetical protein
LCSSAPLRGAFQAAFDDPACPPVPEIRIEAAIGAGLTTKGPIMSNKPTLFAYAVKDRGRNRKAIWTRIGAAWPHEKGNGFTIELEAFPVDGRLVLTEPKQDDAPESSEETETTEAA